MPGEIWRKVRQYAEAAARQGRPPHGLSDAVARSAPPTQRALTITWALFLDLDGVPADFSRGVQAVTE
jgi:hypothetical protein